MSNRIYLAVPFADKDRAKALGAYFDPMAKSWYVPPGLEVAPFAAWRPDQSAISHQADPRSLFAARLRDAGFILSAEHPIMDGQIHHCPVEGGKPYERPGSYRAFGDGVPNGWFQNFRQHDKAVKWVMRTQIPRAARQAVRALGAQHRQDAAAALKEAQDLAAMALQRLWDNGADDVSAHPYLAGKGITDATGLRIAAPGATVRTANADISIAGRLLVPMRNIDGALRSLQIIGDSGQKMFAPGGEAAGSHLILDNLHSPWPLYFTEGYADGNAIHAATGHAVVVTFSVHNLEPVARAYRARFPQRTFFICADNDHRKERETDAQGRPKKNVGREKAAAAAERVKGHVLLPPFAATDSGKDWDDYRRQHGMDGLRLELTRQIVSIDRRRIARETAATRDDGRETQTQARCLSRWPAF